MNYNSKAVNPWAESYRVSPNDYAQTFGADKCTSPPSLLRRAAEAAVDNADVSFTPPLAADSATDAAARAACGIAASADPYAEAASGNCYYDVVVTGDVKLAVAGLAVARASEVFNAGVPLAPMFEDSSVNYTVRLDADFSFIFTAVPPAAAGAGASVAYAVRAAPAGITIDPATGVLVGEAGCVAGFRYSAGPPAVLRLPCRDGPRRYEDSDTGLRHGRPQRGPRFPGPCPQATYPMPLALKHRT